SGLVAATEIQAAGHEVIVLDARDRVGGRVFTIREGFADGQFADIGAEIIYHGQNNIAELCAKHGVELSDEFSLGTDVPDLIFSGERLDRAAAAEIVNELRVAIKKTKPSHYESVAQWLRRARVSEPAELLLAAIAQSTPAAPLRTADAQELNVELSWGEAYRKIKGGNDTLEGAIGSGCFTDRMPGFIMEQTVHQRGEHIIVAGLAAGDIEPSGMTDTQILDDVDATMSSVVGRPIKRVAGFVKSWTHDPWSRAVVRAPIGDQRDTVLPLIAAPLDSRVFFAGEHPDSRVGPGGMEGAIKSGYRVA